MFKIYDGRDKFYQWDLDRKLIVEDPTIKEVHFCNRTGECALICETFEEDGLTLVNVPNVILQTDWKIHVYAYDGAYTKHDECFEVVSRSKPDDYIYTEEELKHWEELSARIDETEEELIASIEATAGRKTADGGEIFNDYESNKSITANSAAFGEGNLAGCKGYYWYKILFHWMMPYGNTPKYIADITVILTKERLVEPTEAFETGYAVGDVVSLVNGNKYTNFGKIKSINKNEIKIVPLVEGDYSFPGFTEAINITEDLPFDYYTFYVADKPEVGAVDVGIGAAAFGLENEASGAYSFAAGSGNKTIGQYGAVVGKDNTVDYCSFASGRGNSAIGFASTAFGMTNNVEGTGSLATGGGNKLVGNYSVVEGQDNNVTGDSSHIGGYGNTVNSHQTFVMGASNKVNTNGYSFIMGLSNNITGEKATAFGDSNTISGARGFAVGFGNKITATSGIAFNAHNQVSSNYSFAAGYNNRAISEGQAVVGKRNKPVNGAFVVGIGKSDKDEDRKNGLVVDWEGNGTFNGTVEGTALILKSPNGTRFKITVDNNGNLSTTKL